jgi:hypothetical protein
VDKLSVTQTLDERQADKGVLILEIKAVGVGLVPDLPDLCTLGWEGFEVVKTEDQGIGVKKFEEDADRNEVVSERAWTITLKAQEGLTELPKAFRFAEVKLPTKESLFQRYVDADLATVTQEVSLEKTYGQPSKRWAWLLAGGVLAGLVLLGGVLWLALRRTAAPVVATLPENPSPFVAAGLLRELRDRPEVTPAQRAAIDQDLAAVEQHFFSADPVGTPAPDLGALVRRWAEAVPGWRASTKPQPQVSVRT